MNPEVKLVFQNQSEIHAFEAVCSAALKTGDLQIAKIVTAFTDRLGSSVAEHNTARAKSTDVTDPPANPAS